MRMIATAVIGLTITTTARAEPAGVWWDTTCTVRLESWPDQPFVVSSADRSFAKECRITDWPFSNPGPTMMCGEEDKAQIIVNDATGVIVIDGLPIMPDGGVTLYANGEDDVGCVVGSEPSK